MTADLSPQEETTLLRIADGDSGEPDVEEADVSRLQSLELVEQRGSLIRPHIERRAKGCPAQAKLTSMPSRRASPLRSAMRPRYTSFLATLKAKWAPTWRSVGAKVSVPVLVGGDRVGVEA